MKKYKFCLWLIERLSQRRMTLAEIAEEWSKSALNDDADILNPRTFQRYRSTTEQLFNIIIEYDKTINSYFIKETSELDEWLMSAIRMHNLVNLVQKSQYIMLEKSPAGSQNLEIILHAIQNKKVIAFNYQSPYQKKRHIEGYPLFLRLFKQRWYVVLQVSDKEFFSILALERMTDIQVTVKPDGLIKKLKLSPLDFFKYSYGIIHGEKPQKIIIRAFWPQDKYLQENPMHESQQMINTNENWSDFYLFLDPTYDFKQELLWHRDKVTVLEPKWLKKDMIDILNRMIKSYETGEPNCKDE